MIANYSDHESPHFDSRFLDDQIDVIIGRAGGASDAIVRCGGTRCSWWRSERPVVIFVRFVPRELAHVTVRLHVVLLLRLACLVLRFSIFLLFVKLKQLLFNHITVYMIVSQNRASANPEFDVGGRVRVVAYLANTGIVVTIVVRDMQLSSAGLF